MPREQIVNGVRLHNIPDSIAPDDPRLLQLAQAQAAAHPTAAQALAQRIEQSRVSKVDPKNQFPGLRRGEAAEMAMEGVQPLERLFTNVGAGEASTLQGLKQLFSDKVSDEDVREKRRADEALANTVGGGGLAQMVGEAAPFMAIPGAGNVLGGAAVGALQGLTQPVTSEESRALNTGTGLALGAAAPWLLKSAAQGSRTALGTGARERAADQIRKAIEDLPPEEVQRLRSPPTGESAADPDLAPGLRPYPLTPAAESGSADLARLEKGRRARNGAEFYPGDVERAKVAEEHLLHHTSEAEELAARKQEGAEGWTNDWARVEGSVDPEIFHGGADWLAQHLEDLKWHKDAENPDVASLLNHLSTRLQKLREQGRYTPGHVQEWRAQLNGQTEPQSQNVFKRAPRSSVPVKNLMNDLDEYLNQSSGGNWQTVLDNYTQAQRKVDQAIAAGKARQRFYELSEENRPVRTRGRTIQDDTPHFTSEGISRAMDAAMGPTGTTALSPQAHQGLSKTLAAMRKQDLPRNVTLSATAGGGSNTASDLFSAADDMAMAGVPWLAKRLPYVGPWVERQGAKAAERENAILDPALANPQSLADLIRSNVNPKAKKLAARFATSPLRAFANQAEQEYIPWLHEAQSEDNP